MDHTPTRPSLRTRILEAESRATHTVDRSHFAPRRQESFAERYRGTEYETPTTFLVAQESYMSRGRSFVLVVGTAAVAMIGLLLVAAPD